MLFEYIIQGTASLKIMEIICHLFKKHDSVRLATDYFSILFGTSSAGLMKHEIERMKWNMIINGLHHVQVVVPSKYWKMYSPEPDIMEYFMTILGVCWIFSCTIPLHNMHVNDIFTESKNADHWRLLIILIRPMLEARPDILLRNDQRTYKDHACVGKFSKAVKNKYI